MQVCLHAFENGSFIHRIYTTNFYTVSSKERLHTKLIAMHYKCLKLTASMLNCQNINSHYAHNSGSAHHACFVLALHTLVVDHACVPRNGYKHDLHWSKILRITDIISIASKQF